ncbi:MAG: hypothetical protein ABIK96_06425 [bacterium]
MRRQLVLWTLWAGYAAALALGAYELVAKSPGVLGKPLPGWVDADRAESSTRWRRPTGILPLDKLLHEGQEALLYYGMLLDPAPDSAPRT